MADLLTLPILTPELATNEKVQPISGLRIADMVKNNPSQPLILLDVQPRLLKTDNYSKAGYVFSFMGKQFLLKFSEAKTALTANQAFKAIVRTAKIDGSEIEYVVAE